MCESLYIFYVFECMYSTYNTSEKCSHALQKFSFIKILCIYSVYFLVDFTHGPKNPCMNVDIIQTYTCMNIYMGLCIHLFDF